MSLPSLQNERKSIDAIESNSDYTTEKKRDMEDESGSSVTDIVDVYS